jgi:hypothetical protein
MSRDISVIPFRQPDAIDDPLTELAREGWRRAYRFVNLRTMARVAESCWPD